MLYTQKIRKVKAHLFLRWYFTYFILFVNFKVVITKVDMSLHIWGTKEWVEVDLQCQYKVCLLPMEVDQWLVQMEVSMG